MAKETRSAHKIVMDLLRRGYTYRQMSEHLDISPSMLYKMGNNENYSPKEETVKKLSKRMPTSVAPHWSKRVGTN